MNLTPCCKNFCIDKNDNEEEEEEEEEEDDDDEEEMNEDIEEDEENADDVSDDEEEEDDDEPDFMDTSGKCWEFASKIRDEKHLKEWCQNKMGGMIVGKEEKLTRQFHCPNKECQFKAILLNACSNIYTRNKHNHQMKNTRNIRQRKEENSPIERDYVDIFGKLWLFRAHVGRNISQDKLLIKSGFTGFLNRKTTLCLYCSKSNPDGGRCPFVGIYLKSNGCLYTRGEHEHTKRKKTPQNEGDEYIDQYGKIWKFNKKIGKKIQHEMLRKKFGFSNIETKGIGLYLRCEIQRHNNKCKFAGIYLKSNGCLYTRGEHEHTKRKKTPKNIGDDYTDIYGKIWKFTKEIGKNIQHELLRNKFGFTRIATKATGLYLRCERGNKNCKFSGIYLNSNGCLYLRGKHNHGEIRQKNLKPIFGDDYVDCLGKTWPFHSKIGKNADPELFRNKFGLSTIRQRKQTLNLYCQKEGINGGRCPLTGIYVKENGCLYIRGKHKHN